jgi:membrane protease subunit (stomatin/prohibitin family)
MIPILMICSIAFIVGTAIYISQKMQEERSIKQNGITVDAVAVKSTYYYKCYNTIVRFAGNDGMMHEAKVVTRGKVAEGYPLQIAYQPNQYDKVVLVTKEPLFKGLK